LEGYRPKVKLPAHRASRARSGEQDASKGNFIHIVPLNPAYKAGLAGHAPVNGSSIPKKGRGFSFSWLDTMAKRGLNSPARKDRRWN